MRIIYASPPPKTYLYKITRWLKKVISVSSGTGIMYEEIHAVRSIRIPITLGAATDEAVHYSWPSPFSDSACCKLACSQCQTPLTDHELCFCQLQTTSLICEINFIVPEIGEARYCRSYKLNG